MKEHFIKQLNTVQRNALQVIFLTCSIVIALIKYTVNTANCPHSILDTLVALPFPLLTDVISGILVQLAILTLLSKSDIKTTQQPHFGKLPYTCIHSTFNIYY